MSLVLPPSSSLLFGHLARFLPPAAAQTRWGRDDARMPSSSPRAGARRCAPSLPACGPAQSLPPRGPAPSLPPRAPAPASRHSDARPAQAQVGPHPLPADGRLFGNMISAGCGDSAAGRELSAPRPLRTDARLLAEVGASAERGRARRPWAGVGPASAA